MAENKNKNNKKNMTKKAVSKRPTLLNLDGVGPLYEYKMGKLSAYCITHDNDGKILPEAKGREDAYLVEYVNSQMGLRGTCVAVIIH